MDKRYQVFLSSTYSDLKDERQSVLQALMEMDCIPAGMELFPAADQEQWAFIQRVIDDCDYYILVLGGRYGTLTSEGISYTEKEFDYAVAKGIKVVALIHGEVEKLAFAKVDASAEAREMLEAFKEKVTTGRLVKFWTESKELPGLVALSLQRTIKMFPAQGWVRSGSLAATEALQKITVLQDRVRELEDDQKTSRRALEPKPMIENLASGADTISLTMRWTVFNSRTGKYDPYNKEISPSWDEIFGILGPEVIAPVILELARISLSEILAHRSDVKSAARIHADDFQTIIHHLAALGLIKVASLPTVKGGHQVFAQITDTGTAYMTKLRAVQKTIPTEA